jgi:hypothetical protein
MQQFFAFNPPLFTKRSGLQEFFCRKIQKIAKNFVSPESSKILQLSGKMQKT